MSEKIKRFAASWYWLLSATGILLIAGAWYFFPSHLFGGFIEPIQITGYKKDGEIFIKDTRIVHRSATPGFYVVRVTKLDPGPQTTICNGDVSQAPYRKTDEPYSIELDLGYYAGWTPGSGAIKCPRAYSADEIAVDVTWCERHIFGLCIGQVDYPIPAVIDLREPD